MGSVLVIYLAGAPASVAVEADLGVTVSVALSAYVFCLWSVGAVSLLSADPPLCGGLWRLVAASPPLILRYLVRAPLHLDWLVARLSQDSVLMSTTSSHASRRCSSAAEAARWVSFQRPALHTEGLC